VKAAELILAYIGVGLGLLSAYLFSIGEDKMAGIVGGIGLAVCNVDLVLRQVG
jgi:hypothetical protein